MSRKKTKKTPITPTVRCAIYTRKSTEEGLEQEFNSLDAVWDCLAPREQARMVELLIEGVNYDGEGGNISIAFHPSGIRTLAGELAAQDEEAA